MQWLSVITFLLESQLEKAKLHVYSVNFRLNIWLGCVCHKECAVHCLWNLT